MRILIFGDSTSQGYYDLEMGGWANRLFTEHMKKKARQRENLSEVFNISVSGDTTKRVLHRLRNEIEVRLWGNEPLMIIFAVGVNDAVLENSRPVSNLAQYAQELQQLYDIASEYAKQIIFVGLEAVDEAESAPWKYNSGSSVLEWKNERIQLFDATLKSFTEEKGAGYVPIFDTFIEHQRQGAKLHADGLHPNSAGHGLIFNQVKLFIGEVAGSQHSTASFIVPSLLR